MFKIWGTGHINEIKVKDKIKKEITRIKRFNQSVLGIRQEVQIEDVDLREYTKFILKDGPIEEKRELLGSFNSKIFLKKKSIFIKES